VLKNVCAKVSPQLSDDIDDICGLLSISKRRFLEAAMLEAVSKARYIIQREELDEVLVGDDYDLSNAAISDGDA